MAHGTTYYELALGIFRQAIPKTPLVLFIGVEVSLPKGKVSLDVLHGGF